MTAVRNVENIAGQILIGGQAIECVLAERTEGSARLSLPCSAGVPEHFLLGVPSLDEQRRARVEFRRQGENGADLWVRFEAA